MSKHSSPPETTALTTSATLEPAEPTQAPRWALSVLLAVYIILTSLLILNVPINGAPDEAAHIQYVQHLATRGALPVFVPLGANYPGYEFHQPPLYYLLCLPLWKATGAGVQYYMCRLVSLLCGALTLVLLWRAVVALFPNDPRLPILTTGFAALWPLHQGVGASAANGALSCLFCSAVFYTIARASQRQWKMTDSLLAGAFVGCGILTATASLVMLFVAAGAAWYFVSCDNEQGANDSPVYATAAVVGVALLISGWWLMRNQRLYGDALALGIFNQAFSKSNPGPAQFLTVFSLTTYLRAFLTILFCTAWGIFGGPETADKMMNPFRQHGPRPEALPGLIFGLACMVATVLVVWGLIRFAKFWQTQPAAARAALRWWSIGFILVLLSFVQFNLHYYQAQARYLHPALLPIALAFGLGWREVFGDPSNTKLCWLASSVFGVVLLVLSLWNALGWRTLV
ncbi:MAG: hypothetical protein JO316_15455 [Abitibacteriaceae bacterium]|nr:hypothetical protein [Abditibacteriaceae bacterium]